MSRAIKLTNRRRFLLTVVGIAVPAALPQLRPWRALVEIRTTQSVDVRLAHLLDHRDSAQVVGREYLRGTTEERTARALVDAIASGLPGGPDTVRAASRLELQRLIYDRVQQDFEDDLTVDLCGWIVSRTEARLCALVAVTRGA